MLVRPQYRAASLSAPRSLRVVCLMSEKSLDSPLTQGLGERGGGECVL